MTSSPGLQCSLFFLSIAIRESCILLVPHNMYRDLKCMECKNIVTAMHSGLWLSFIWIGPPPRPQQQKTGGNYAWIKNTNLRFFLCSSSSLLHSFIQECCQQYMLRSIQSYIHPSKLTSPYQQKYYKCSGSLPFQIQCEQITTDLLTWSTIVSPCLDSFRCISGRRQSRTNRLTSSIW